MKTQGRGNSGSVALILLAVLVAGGVTLGGMDAGWAQAPAQQAGPFPAMSTFQSGRITGVRGTTVQIDGRDYELAPNVEIKRPDGVEMEAHDIRKGALAQFHLKQGRIDKLVVILPD